MNFEFATAGRIVFGEGVVEEAGPLAANLGRRALVVAGGPEELGERLVSILESRGVESRTFRIRGEPTVFKIGEGVELARREGCNLVAGLGGGSALDAAKAIAILAENPGDIYDYLEVIGRGRSLESPGLPVIAIPTTAGTGAEVTRNAVLGSPDHRVKVSLRSPMMLPAVALVDPELSYDLPPAITASTGMDALTQLIEPFVSNRANPLTDAVCRVGMARAARSLRRAFHHLQEFDARRDMSLASLMGGLALSNAKLGAVHGFAGVLGGMLEAPHGAICASLLPSVMAKNVLALRSREPEHPALQRYDEIAKILTNDPAVQAADGVAWIQELALELEIPPLSSYGLRREDFPVVMEKSAVSSSMQGNPVKLTVEELDAILEGAL